MSLTCEVEIQDCFLTLVEKFQVSIFDWGQCVVVNAALTNHSVFCFAEEQRSRRQRWLWRFWLSQQAAARGTLAACSSLCLHKSGLSKSKNPVKQEFVCLQNEGWMPRRNWVGKTVQQKNQKLFIPLTYSSDWYTWKQCSGKAAFYKNLELIS